MGLDAVTAMTRCPRCSTVARESDRFCGGCGSARGAVAELTAAVEDACDDDAVTAPIPVPGPRGRHHRVPETPLSAPSTGSGAPDAAVPPGTLVPSGPRASAPTVPVPPWAVPALAAGAGLAQLVDAVVAFPTEAVNGADWSTLAVATLPAFGIAAAFVALAVAANRRTRPVPVCAAVLALATVTAGLFSSPESTPGPMTCMLAVAVALLAVVPGVASPGARRPGMPGPAAAEAPLAWWWVGGCVAAALHGFVISHEVDGGTAGQVVGGVLFLGLAVAGAVCAPLLRGVPDTARWVLTALWPLDAVAVSLSDSGGHVVWPLLSLHLGLVAVLIWPLVLTDRASGRLTTLVSRVADAPQLGVLGGAAAVVLGVGVLVAFTGVSSSSGVSDTGSTLAVGVVGVLALAVACTPTMTPLWRSGLVAGATLSFWMAWDRGSTLNDGESTFMWTVFFPVALIGLSGWGALSNRRTGATASRPGWLGAGALPPMIPVPFVAPPTAGARSTVCLELASGLAPEELLDAVRRTTAVRGNWFRTYGDAVEVVGRGLGLKIGSTCAFRALVGGSGERSVLRVGGMDAWTKSRWFLDFIIPISPAKVEGFRMYKLFLLTVASEATRLDPSARARIGRPSSDHIAGP